MVLRKLIDWIAQWRRRPETSDAVAPATVMEAAVESVPIESVPAVVELPSDGSQWLFAIARTRPAVSDFCALIEQRLGDDPALLEALHAFQVAFDELLTNVVDYAQGAADEPMGVAFSRDRDRVDATIRYRAVAYDPTAREAPDTESGIAQRAIGGLGIHLVKSLMDEFRHHYVDGYNVLTLSKRIGANPPTPQPSDTAI
jgi:serine/threonine-protein kinase RsbW